MARSKRRTRQRTAKPKAQGRARYTATEIFVALIGLGVLVLVVGIVVSEFLE